jgi:lysophospholipase L1-like esterase
MSFPLPRLFHRGRHLLLWTMAFVLAAAAAPWVERGATADRCHASGGVASFTASLPHVAARLEAGEPVTIVALGSSSTLGIGATRPEYSYPSRLTVELHQRFGAEVRVLNQGVGGDAMGAMLRRIERDVVVVHPDLVVWQVGTNDVLHDDDAAASAAVLRDGVQRLKTAGIDVILMDIQYAPEVLAHEGYHDMLHAIAAVGIAEGVPVFRRFQVMQSWDETGVMPVRAALADDRLHMNDRSYGCLARLLADGIATAAR